MAENRGLFGSTTSQSSKKSTKTRKKTDNKRIKPRPRKKLQETEVDFSNNLNYFKDVKPFQIARIAAPTYTFLTRTSQNSVRFCLRCACYQKEPTSRYKKWWVESARHIIELKKFLVKHRKLPNQKITQLTAKQIVNSLMAASQLTKVDEMAKTISESSKFPIFPKLRLSRDVSFVKVPAPIGVTNVEFRECCVFCK